MYTDKAVKKALQEKYGNEMVFVVPYSEMTHVPDKFAKSEKGSFASLRTYDNKGRYVLRSDAEQNPSFQQLIPYVIITNEDETKFFVAKRIAGDERLLKTMSLGFGGHINACDKHTNVILNALERELEEELDIKRIEGSLSYEGTMRDLKSPTSEHTGFIFTLKAKSASVLETESLEGQWMTKQDLFEEYFKFEGWSKYYIDYLFEEENKED